MLWSKSYMPRVVLAMFKDCRGLAATEFAVIVPIMLVMFFGTVEFSSGVAVDRKVTLMARTISDITSQAQASTPQYAVVTDTYLQNAFTAGIAILQPYDSTPAKAIVSEIYVDSTGVAKIQWSRAATFASGATKATLVASSRNSGDVVTNIVPPALLQKSTYLIFSEINYLYTPTVGYVMAKDGVTLADVAYSRPRQATCLDYNNLPANNSCPLT
ncbi:MAG TPA: TadE/TadG family type IV pilus assembly protein [Bradyrhizobium sp.]|nr:TadE/TadG family type IV pilus assembly protein [Bradyrhizobium sp.]